MHNLQARGLFVLRQCKYSVSRQISSREMINRTLAAALGSFSLDAATELKKSRGRVVIAPVQRGALYIRKAISLGRGEREPVKVECAAGGGGGGVG